MAAMPWCACVAAISAQVALAALPLVARAAATSETTFLLPLDGTEQKSETYGRRGAERSLRTVAGEGNTLDGNGALQLSATTGTTEGSEYAGVMVSLPEPVDLRERRLVVHARTNRPGTTAAFYVRAYNRGENKPAWSFNSWNARLASEWREFRLQAGLSLDGLAWEQKTVEDREGTTVDRLEFIIGTREDDVPIDVLLDSVQIGKRLVSFAELDAPHPHQTSTELVREGRSQVTILHPDSTAGREAAAFAR